MAGAELKANYPVSVITDGMGLNITVMSYCGHLDFGIVADRDQMPDVWKLIEWLEESLAELLPQGTEIKPPAPGGGADGRGGKRPSRRAADGAGASAANGSARPRPPGDRRLGRDRYQAWVSPQWGQPTASTPAR